MIEIKDKKILFLSPSFFEYEKKIVDKMEKMGANVDFYDERSITSSKEKALLKVFPQIFKKKSTKYYNKIIEENKTKSYDFILIVKCDMIPESILIKFKHTYHKAKMCLYLWDSFKNIPRNRKKIEVF